jgi:chain length determinant protein EpsF
MAMNQFLRMLVGRKWLFLTVLLLVMALGIGGTMLWPKRYTAEVNVLLDLRNPDAVSGVPGSPTGSATYLATEIDVVRSQRVALRVVDSLNLAANKELRKQFSDSKVSTPLREWIADLLVSQLKVKPSRESTVLQISYAGKAYVDTNLELRVEPARQQSVWFDERVKKLRESLDAAQRKLGDYQRTNKIVSVDERLDVENMRLQELSTRLVALQGQSAESGSRAAVAVTALKSGPKALSELPDVLQSSHIQMLKNDRANLEKQLADVGGNLGVNHPNYLKLKEEIESIRKRTEQEMISVARALESTHVVNRQREQEARVALDRQREKVIAIKSQRDEFTVLTRDVETAERAFEETSQRGSKAGLASNLRQSNLMILDKAVPPSRASSPNTIVNSIVSLVLGLLAAIAAVLMAEMPNRHVFSARDAAEFGGLPVIGTVGRSNRRLRLRRKSRSPLLTSY